VADFVVPRAPSPIRGTFDVPPSKSIAQRALALAALSDAPTELVGAGLLPDDVARFATAVRLLAGASARTDGAMPGGWTAWGLGGGRSPLRLDLGMNGTGFRFAIALSGLRPVGARTLVTGRPRLRARPHGGLLRALTRLGAHARRRSSGAVRVLGRPWARHDVDVRADVSSQYVSALLLAAPRAGGLCVRTGEHAVSRGYVELTASVLEAFGIPVAIEGGTITVAAGAPCAARFVIEPDASSAAVWWTLAALSGGSAAVRGLPAASRQPDVALLEILRRMGAGVTEEGGGVVVTASPGRLRAPGDVDLRDAPDLAPLVAVLAARAEGETRVVGAPHLRFKESDRIGSLARALVAVGADVTATDDGFRVRPGPAVPRARIDTAGDHRLALAFGALGVAQGGVVLSDASVVSKSYPGFFERCTLLAEAQNP